MWKVKLIFTVFYRSPLYVSKQKQCSFLIQNDLSWWDPSSPGAIQPGYNKKQTNY